MKPVKRVVPAGNTYMSGFVLPRKTLVDAVVCRRITDLQEPMGQRFQAEKHTRTAKAPRVKRNETQS